MGKVRILTIYSLLLSACLSDAIGTVGNCGDGQVATGEECDLGDYNSGDASCLTNCIAAFCGDGFTWAGNEACDDGNKKAGDGCSPSCAIEEQCGNGVVNLGEECDDGNDIDEDGCLSKCMRNTCGDGHQNPNTEACDDGVLNSDVGFDGCRINCSLASCGDGVIDSGEECDDGGENENSAGHCRENCRLASCGDGVVDTDEECDSGDSNADAPDADCRTDCTLPRCGDGVTDSGENCDSGAASDTCDSDCTFVMCGDSLVNTEAGEDCDGTVLPTAECNFDCSLSACGDGVLNPESGELCEAGTALANGACSLNCGLICDQGFDDCDGNLQNGCEQSVSDDPNNCGACGRDCGGGACVAGECMPVDLLSVPGVGLFRDEPDAELPLASVLGEQVSFLYRLKAPTQIEISNDAVMIIGAHTFMAENIPEYANHIDSLAEEQRLSAPEDLPGDSEDTYHSSARGIVRFSGATSANGLLVESIRELPPGYFVGHVRGEDVYLSRFSTTINDEKQYFGEAVLSLSGENSPDFVIDESAIFDSPVLYVADSDLHLASQIEDGLVRVQSSVSSSGIEIEIPSRYAWVIEPALNYHLITQPWIGQQPKELVAAVPYVRRDNVGVVGPVLYESPDSESDFYLIQASNVRLTSFNFDGSVSTTKAYRLSKDNDWFAQRPVPFVKSEIMYAAREGGSLYVYLPAVDTGGLIEVGRDGGTCSDGCDVLGDVDPPFSVESIIPAHLAVIGSKLTLAYAPRVLAQESSSTNHETLFIYQYDLDSGRQSTRTLNQTGEVFAEIQTSGSYLYVTWVNPITSTATLRRVKLD